MSGSIFVFAETPAAAAELVTLARDLNRSCRIVACGCPDPEIYADCGADGVLSLGGGLAVSYAKALAALMKERGAEILRNPQKLAEAVEAPAQKSAPAPKRKRGVSK